MNQTQKNKDYQEFAAKCIATGDELTAIDEELSRKNITNNSKQGIVFKKERLATLFSSITASRKCSQVGGSMPLPERAWIAHFKYKEGYDRIDPGTGKCEAELMWEEACRTHQPEMNTAGDNCLRVELREKINMKTASNNNKSWL